MKKIVKITAVMLLVVLSLAVLVSCGPNSDPAKAEASLKKNGYTVTNMTGAVSTGAAAVLIGLDGEDVTNIIVASKKDDSGETQSIIAIYCKDAATAKSAVEKAQENITAIENLLHIKFEGESNVVRSGAILYTGTDAAVKATR
ncbi:MAG: hypothetical protein NC332_00520 [Firmicutes bacterium]|nr:hypothetical protein [Bacillota bacterium]